MASWQRTYYSAFIAQFIAIAGFAFVLPFLPFYLVHDLGVPEGKEASRWAGILLAAVGLPMAICGPIWGTLADRYGRKPMVLRAMYSGALVIGLMSVVQNVHQLLVLRAVQGALTGTVSASMALVSSVTPKERTGQTLGMMQAAVFAGSAIGPFLGGITAYYVGYRAAFLVAGATLLLGGLLIQFFAEENFQPQVTGIKAKGSYGELLKTGGFVVAMLALFQVHLAANAPGPIFSFFVRQLSGLDIKPATKLTGEILSAAGVLAALAAWLFGRFADAWGYKRMLVACALLAALTTLPQAFATSVRELFLWRCLFALATAGVLPSANAIISRVTPAHNLGRAFGLTSSMAGVAFFVGPLCGGYLSAHFDSYGPPFILSAALFAVVAVLAAWLIKPIAAAPVEPPAPTSAPAAVSPAPLRR